MDKIGKDQDGLQMTNVKTCGLVLFFLQRMRHHAVHQAIYMF